MDILSGSVAKWLKAADCKSAIGGSNPPRASSVRENEKRKLHSGEKKNQERAEPTRLA